MSYHHAVKDISMVPLQLLDLRRFLDSLERFLLASDSIFSSRTARTTAGLFVTFQELILTLHRFWADHGCVIHQPYDVEMGAGTFHPATFLRSLGPEPWRSAYAQPCPLPTIFRNFTWKVSRAWASIPRSMTSGLSRTIGNPPRLAPGDWAGKSGW